MRKDNESGVSRAGLTVRSVLLFLGLSGIILASCDGTPRQQAGDALHPERPPESASGSMERSAPRAGGIVRHRHDPKHGGVVRSVDVYHVEVVNEPLRVWLYDRHGEPLDLEGVEGQVVVYTEDERHPRSLERAGQVLVSDESTSLPDSGTVFVELTVGEKPIDVALNLPLGSSESMQSTDAN